MGDGPDPENRLNDRLNVLAGHLNTINAELTAVVAEMLEHGTWQQAGRTTPSSFLQWQLGLSPARADDVIRVARRRGDFPVLIAGFDRGEFALEQISAAVDAPAWADADIYDFVKIATVAKIRRAMRSNMFDDEPPETEPPRPGNRVSFGVGRDGRWRLRGEFDLVDGRRIEAALTERKDALFTADEPATWADALLDCAERSLDAVESPSRRDRHRTWVHLDVTSGDATTTDGWRLPPSLRDRILCEGTVQPVWERDGVPFSIGRAQHIVPDRTRRIVERRDRGCRVPGCTNDRYVEIHHIVHWLDGGRSDTSNLISLCPRHHKMHHRGELGIRGNADRFDDVVFTDQAGHRIPGSGAPAPPTSPPPPPVVPYRPPLAERFDWNWIGLGWIRPDRITPRATAA